MSEPAKTAARNATDRYREYQRAYRQRNADRIRVYACEWKLRNIEHVLEQAARREACPHCGREMLRASIKGHVERQHPEAADAAPQG